MGRHAERRGRTPVPWVSAIVLGLIAGATGTGVLLWGGSHTPTAVVVGVLTAVVTGIALALSARLPAGEPDGDQGPDAVP